MERILTGWLDIPGFRKLDVYLAQRRLQGARKALFDVKNPRILSTRSKNSNLRGRGGAAFPTGVKWSFIPKESKKPVYVCVNGDESEPGTFADRYQFETDPHGIIERFIACRAVGSHCAYIYLRRRVHGAAAEPRSGAGRSTRRRLRRQGRDGLRLRRGNLAA